MKKVVVVKKKEILADQELSLKEKYQQLREKKTKQTQSTSTDDAQAKLEAAKRILAQTGGGLEEKSAEKSAGFKRPTRKKKTAREEDEQQEEEEDIRKKQKSNSDEPQRREEYYDDRRSERTNWREEPEEADRESEFHPSTVFIGDLGDFVDEVELDRAFSKFGPIDSIRLITGKNFAFVTFQMIEAAQSAINHMNGEILGGGRIRVAPAKVQGRRNWKDGNRSEFRPEASLLPMLHDQNIHEFGIEGYVARDEATTKTTPVKEEVDPAASEREMTSYEDL